ncbi:MAG TPA: hypothetical protein VK071_12350 [Tissierellales bacterium]|nr:hypothetical protein [Tissierellales bacterium]
MRDRHTVLEREKLTASQNKLIKERIRLVEEVRGINEEIKEIEDLKEMFESLIDDMNKILDDWEEEKSKVIYIGEIIPESFDGDIAEKQATDLPKISKEMGINVGKATSLLDGVQRQISKLNDYKNDLQSQIKQISRQIDSKDFEIRSIDTRLSNMQFY